MGGELTFRRASQDDLETIVALMLQDTLAHKREFPLEKGTLDQCYKDAFRKIEADENHYLMVVECAKELVGTCHLTIIPSLTFKGSTRLQIEAVRVSKEHRGKQIGSKMIAFSLEYARKKGASIVQLTTNKERPDAIRFYEKQGFKTTHEGMKLYL